MAASRKCVGPGLPLRLLFGQVMKHASVDRNMRLFFFGMKSHHFVYQRRRLFGMFVERNRNVDRDFFKEPREQKNEPTGASAIAASSPSVQCIKRSPVVVVAFCRIQIRTQLDQQPIKCVGVRFLLGNEAIEDNRRNKRNFVSAMFQKLDHIAFKVNEQLAGETGEQPIDRIAAPRIKAKRLHIHVVRFGDDKSIDRNQRAPVSLSQRRLTRSRRRPSCPMRSVCMFISCVRKNGSGEDSETRKRNKLTEPAPRNR